ncbi:hypothetical protein AVEN_8911-1 [Araneus ventricosus]|uniref:Uncharacterized protein n=1 Tax=Araneus ventricosus TaxID=182803 RepID=A0A4Y2DI57_ARAVE|nr:hypothetical protein AVEN_8911-1 [Araneus ventricosus]
MGLKRKEDQLHPLCVSTPCSVAAVPKPWAAVNLWALDCVLVDGGPCVGNSCNRTWCRKHKGNVAEPLCVFDPMFYCSCSQTMGRGPLMDFRLRISGLRNASQVSKSGELQMSLLIFALKTFFLNLLQ